MDPWRLSFYPARTMSTFSICRFLKHVIFIFRLCAKIGEMKLFGTPDSDCTPLIIKNMLQGIALVLFYLDFIDSFSKMKYFHGNSLFWILLHCRSRNGIFAVGWFHLWDESFLKTGYRPMYHCYLSTFRNHLWCCKCWVYFVSPFCAGPFLRYFFSPAA